jgi:glycosyltransferase involved in cell wall biosynthesis
MNRMLLTIFTPTFNRAYILPKLYKSLCAQKKDDYDFEWLIIDDESSDNTCELINAWKKENNNFQINYFKQKHGGKHRALNKAFDYAKGKYIFIVDSDDSLKENAVKLIDSWILEIDDDTHFAGVAGMKISNTGKVWGGTKNFKQSYVDATNFERRKYNLLGDKAEIYRTKILKMYKFPEIANEFFVTEDYCWMQIAAAGYKIRWHNEPIYVCEYLEDGLTKTGANSTIGHIDNYIGYCLYIQKCLELKPFTEKIINFREYNRTMKEIKKPLLKRGKDIHVTIIRYICLLVLGIPMAYLYRKVRFTR